MCKSYLSRRKEKKRPAVGLRPLRTDRNAGTRGRGIIKLSEGTWKRANCARLPSCDRMTVVCASPPLKVQESMAVRHWDFLEFGMAPNVHPTFVTVRTWLAGNNCFGLSVPSDCSQAGPSSSLNYLSFGNN